jgi:hypothetical protein
LRAKKHGGLLQLNYTTSRSPVFTDLVYSFIINFLLNSYWGAHFRQTYP